MWRPEASRAMDFAIRSVFVRFTGAKSRVRPVSAENLVFFSYSLLSAPNRLRSAERRELIY